MTPTAKLSALHAIAASMSAGASEPAACSVSGISIATYARWRRAYDAGGIEALADKRAGHAGRRPVARLLTTEARDYLRKLAVGCGSQASAVDEFLASPMCPAEIRDALDARSSRHRIPLSLRRAMSITPEMQAMWKGPKQFQASAFIQRRDMTMIDPSGQRVPVEPGDWWELDDQSTNQPFWFELPEGETSTRQGTGDRLAERHSVALGRQGLFAVDICSGKWLAHELIGRPRDAYRAEDILRFLRRLFEDFGLPRFGLRLERGVWKSRSITGEKVEMPEDQRQIVVNGLSDLGIHVEYCYQSRGKPFVEGGFDHLQTRMSIEGLKRGWRDIGRFRGEMERETTALMRCKAGVAHPKDAGFPHISQLAVAYQDGMDFLNAHAKEGRLQTGIPDERFQLAVQSAPLRVLDPQHAGVFLPVKFDTVLKGGHVSKTIAGQAYHFGAPEIAARLGNGYRLLACFDPSDPWRGCELYNLETGSRNTLNLAPGAHVGCAEWSEAAPQFGPGAADTREQRKRYSRAFRSVYAAAGLAGVSGRRIQELRDGTGRRMAAETKPRPAESALAPAPIRTDAELDLAEAEARAALTRLEDIALHAG